MQESHMQQEACLMAQAHTEAQQQQVVKETKHQFQQTEATVDDGLWDVQVSKSKAKLNTSKISPHFIYSRIVFQNMFQKMLGKK